MAVSIQEKLKRFYSQFTGEDQVLITINADPDAIACAMGIKRLLWRKVANVTITHINVIKRPDNLAMIRLLGVRLEQIETIDPSRFSRFVIVDSQPSHHELFGRFRFDVVIDHHPPTPTDAPLMDIRPDYGATASILTEYLRTARIKPSAKLATGLFYAIKTDTDNFKRRAITEDIRAFQYLFHHANLHLARKIEQSEMRRDFLRFFKDALQNRRIRKGRVFVHLGPVPTPDILVLVADFFMRVEEINWSIVSGLYERKLIVILRNDGIRKNAGNVVKQSFGQFGSAGGHKSAARAEIPLNELAKVVDPKENGKLFNWIISQLVKNAGKR
jgi:nanoRNase/pAp phosphatase (c-di-AMP/oligoRNAs hydrolase)